MNRIKRILQDEKTIVYLFYAFIIIAIGVSIQKYLGKPEPFWFGEYTHYNNYIIFKNSFKHLVDNSNLYIEYRNEYGDFYKYSPTFALFMSAFYYLPDLVGLSVWNILNTLLLFFGIKKLNGIKSEGKILILLFVLFELITSMQNSQSNALIAGLIILAFANTERKNFLIATLLIILTFYIKISGLVACLLFLLYPERKKIILYSIFWTAILALLPLIVVSPGDLIEQYKNWLVLLKTDNEQSFGISIFGIINSWFGIDPPRKLLLILGVASLILPLTRVRMFGDYIFRVFYLSSILIWIVIFNHKAESPSFIIAISGCALWYYFSERKPLDNALIILCLVLISLSPTDMFPRSIRNNFVIPYSLKALPAVLVFLKITYELAFRKKEINRVT